MRVAWVAILLALGTIARAATVGPELVLDARHAYPVNQLDGGADLLYDGSGYFVTWSGYSALPGDVRASYVLLGARMTADGSAIGPGFTYLASDGAHPSVAFDGTSYLVAWEDRSSDLAGDVQAVRVRPVDLSALPSGGGMETWIPLATDCGVGQVAPRVAFDPTSGIYLVVWQDERDAATGPDLYAARVRASDGVALDPGGRLLSSEPGAEVRPAVAGGAPQGNEGTFAVAWLAAAPGENTGRVRAVTVRAADGALGVPVDVSSAPTADLDQPLALVPDRLGGHVVAWTDSRAGNRDVYAARLDAAGMLLGTEVGVATEAVDEARPVATFDSVRSVLVYSSLDAGMASVQGLVLNTPDDQRLDVAARFALPAMGEQDTALAMAVGVTDYLLLRQLGQGAATMLLRTRMRGDLSAETSGDPLVTPHASTQQEPAVAPGPTGFLAVWTDDAAGSGRRSVFGRLVSATGELAPTPLAPIGSGNADAIHPALARGGSGYLVAWADRRRDPEASACAASAPAAGLDLMAQRLGADGSSVGGELTLGADPGHQSHPAIASDGQSYLVVWEDGSQPTVALLGIRLDAQTGMRRGSGLVIARGSSNHVQPKVAWGGSSYLVVWTDDRNRATAGLDVYGARLDASGNRLGAELALATSAVDEADPTVASDGTGFLVAWTGVHAPGSSDTDVRGLLLDATGAPQGGELSMEANPVVAESAPRLTFDGTDYVVASLVGTGAQSGVFARRLTRAGAIVDPQAIPLSVATPVVESAALASDGAGHTLVAFGGFDPDPMLLSTRARAAILTSLPGGAACSTPDECESGACESRVCAAQAGAAGAGGAGPNAGDLPNGRYRPGCASGDARASGLCAWLVLVVLLRRRLR